MFGLFRKSKASKTCKPARRERRLGLEPLEDRLALSSYYTLSNGVLTLYGDPYRFATDDSFTVDLDRASNNEVLINVNGQTAGFASNLVQSISIYTGGGANTVSIYASNYVPVTVNSGGNDIVFLGKAGSVQGITGIVTLHNPSNYTNLYINDSADTAAQANVMVSDTSVLLGNCYVQFDNLSALSIFAGSGGNTFYVTNTPATYNPNGGPAYTYIDAGKGYDSVLVTGTTGFLSIDNSGGTDYVNIGNNGPYEGEGRLDRINGEILVCSDSTLGTTSLVVDGGLDSGATPTLDDGSLTDFAPALIRWKAADANGGGVTGLTIWADYDIVNTFTVLNTTAFQDITLLASRYRGPKTINVLGTTGTLAIQDGFETRNPQPANVINIGGNGTGTGSLANILGSVVLSDRDESATVANMIVNIDDSGDAEAQSMFVSRHGYSGTGIHLAGSTVFVRATPVSLNVFGSAGGTVFDFTGFSQMDLAVHLFGLSEGDVLKGPVFGPAGGNVWTVAGLGQGQLDGGVTFDGIETLMGANDAQANENDFRILPGGRLAGAIYGGTGFMNVVDYSAWTTGVSINLATGAATGIAGGVHDIRSAIGGAGADSITGGALGGYLVGRAGNDAILGGSARNIIIGSGGADALVGGSLSDLIISDRTSFGDYASLRAITSEWLRTDKDYTGRMYDLRYGGGLNGSKILAWGATVLDDASQDRLVGQAGRDWFFANLYSGVIDIIQDLNNGGAEQVD